MLRIIVEERPYFGHDSSAIHEYETNEGAVSNITFDRFLHELVIELDTCADKLTLHIDQLKSIRIEND